VADGRDDLTHGDPLAGVQVEALAVLHRPAGIGQLAVDQHTRPLLGRELAGSPSRRSWLRSGFEQQAGHL